MPSPTASPCRSLSEKPAAASNAWPNVWPRLSSIAVAGLALVARHDRRPWRGSSPRWRVRATGPPANRSRQLASSHSKKSGVAEQAVFHHFRIAGAEFALRQSVEQRRVGDHQDRLIERADQVLALTGVDRRSCRRPKNRPAPAASSAPARNRHRAAPLAAAKPPRSPTTPPPSATTMSSRSIFAAMRASQTRLEMRKLLLLSPAGTLTDEAPMPALVERGLAPPRDDGAPPSRR